MSWRKNRYNKRSAKKFGWHPSWFGDNLIEFDNNLISCIVAFQHEHDLKPDGLVGPVTFRRLLSERDLQDLEDSKNYILINGAKKEINWDVKINLIKPGCYRKKNPGQRDVNMIVTHWDATTSADRCKRVLEARNISTHFCIDNDGVIHQFLDTKDIAWHAGSGNNSDTIGVDFSNAYYLKYNKFYQKKGLPKRPVLSNSRVHGVNLKPHLGYYPVQIEAYKKLISLLCKEHKIPLQVPRNVSEQFITRVHPPAANGTFHGIVCHYHLTRNKIDCAGLELDKIIDQLG